MASSLTKPAGVFKRPFRPLRLSSSSSSSSSSSMDCRAQNTTRNSRIFDLNTTRKCLLNPDLDDVFPTRSKSLAFGDIITSSHPSSSRFASPLARSVTFEDEIDTIMEEDEKEGDIAEIFGEMSLKDYNNDKDNSNENENSSFSKHQREILCSISETRRDIMSRNGKREVMRKKVEKARRERKVELRVKVSQTMKEKREESKMLDLMEGLSFGDKAGPGGEK